jgi:hypothetical protein
MDPDAIDRVVRKYAAAISADSAPIGDSRALYRDGILSHVNQTAARLGAHPGMTLKEFVDILTAAARAP